jgi:hypothetical protein
MLKFSAIVIAILLFTDVAAAQREVLTKFVKSMLISDCAYAKTDENLRTSKRLIMDASTEREMDRALEFQKHIGRISKGTPVLIVNKNDKAPATVMVRWEDFPSKYIWIEKRCVNPSA